MPIDELYGKSTTWRRAKAVFVKRGAAWSRAKAVYVKVAGTWYLSWADAVAFGTASGAVIDANNWTFNWTIVSTGTEPGGGFGCIITVEDTSTTLEAANYPNAASAGGEAIATPSGVSYTARLFNKSGTEVASAIFTPS